MLFYCAIPFKTDIDKSVYFCHNVFGVIINSNAKIMEWGIIQNRVLIGDLTTYIKLPLLRKGVFLLEQKL